MLDRRTFIQQSGIVVSGFVANIPLLNSSKKSKMKQDTTFDVIIIGGSYSGLSAAMALGRALRKVLVIDAGNPCNKQTPHSHNFLTNDGKTPKEITNLAKQQLQQYPTVRLLDGFASKGTQTAEGFTIQTESGELFSSRKLIVATGIKDRMPAIPGFAESWGISVLHCPYCHGYEVRNQPTGILADGETGIELSSLIANWTKDLTLYTNGPSALTDEQKAKLEKNQIDIVETEINRLDHAHGYINNIVFKDGSKTPVKAIYARLPFVQHSSIPQELGAELTQDGFIKIDNAHRTSVPGLYACGDNTTKMRTVANAVSMGTTTAFMVNKELIEEDF